MSDFSRHTLLNDAIFPPQEAPFSPNTQSQRLTEMIQTIRKEIPQEEFDYQTLLGCLKDYARPRDKISDLLEKGIIIRVKKGLYIFGDEYRRRPYSREILANLIYGPSYISLDYALQHYGLIPERVEAVTSVTTGRSRKFSTPVGIFTYRMIPLGAFRIGMDRIEIGEGRAFLIATPEKALADKLHDVRGIGIQTQKELSNYLEEDLRIDTAALKELKPMNLDAIARRYRSRRIRLLTDLVRHIRRQRGKGNVHA
jgi:predicted transcriptional regulator of viral defense system